MSNMQLHTVVQLIVHMASTAVSVCLGTQQSAGRIQGAGWQHCSAACLLAVFVLVSVELRALPAAEAAPWAALVCAELLQQLAASSCSSCSGCSQGRTCAPQQLAVVPVWPWLLRLPGAQETSSCCSSSHNSMHVCSGWELLRPCARLTVEQLCTGIFVMWHGCNTTSHQQQC